MEILGADANFAPKPKFKSIGKACGGIDIHCRCVHLIQEFPGIPVILSDNGFRMPCIVLIDIGDRLVYGSYSLNGQDIVYIFPDPVLLC